MFYIHHLNENRQQIFVRKYAVPSKLLILAKTKLISWIMQPLYLQIYEHCSYCNLEENKIDPQDLYFQ